MIKILNIDYPDKMIVRVKGHRVQIPQSGESSHTSKISLEVTPEATGAIRNHEDAKDQLFFEIFNEKSNEEKLKLYRELERIFFNQF